GVFGSLGREPGQSPRGGEAVRRMLGFRGENMGGHGARRASRAQNRPWRVPALVLPQGDHRGRQDFARDVRSRPSDDVLPPPAFGNSLMDSPFRGDLSANRETIEGPERPISPTTRHGEWGTHRDPREDGFLLAL